MRLATTSALLFFLTLQAADRVYTNGTVLTLDSANHVAQALVTRNGRILFVGTNAEARRKAAAGALVTDLKGHTVVPGFYAAHDHFPAVGALGLTMVDLASPPVGTTYSITNVRAKLHVEARNAAPGAWVVGARYDDTAMDEKRHPTRKDLDDASTTHPIWIYHTSGHMGVANTLALQMAGITRDTPDPPNGRIQKDKDGEPTGVIEEALDLVTRHIPKPSPAQQYETIQRADSAYRLKGVTTTVIAGVQPAELALLEKAQLNRLLHIRVIPMLAHGTQSAKVAAGAHQTVKIVQDGSIQNYTGFLSTPYAVQPRGSSGWAGYPARGRADLVELVRNLHRGGYQIAIHGNGDAAIDDIIAAFREAQRDFPRPDARHRIEHCQMVREDQLDAIQELGITPSFFVGHVYYWGDRHREIFLGPERAARISPLASALRRGVRFTLHDDTPVTPVDPLLAVHNAVNRVTVGGQVLGEDQRVPALAALRAVTVEAAWQNFEEASKGTLEAGKLADFVVLDRNPLSVPPGEIRAVKVLATVIGGEVR